MTDIQRWTIQAPWLETSCGLGEGPFYEKQTGKLRFVDIKKKHLHYVDVAQGHSSLKTIQLDVCPTVTANIAGVDPRERIALGIKYGLAVLDVSKETYELVQPFNDPHNERIRANDGNADPQGRYWLGSMTDFGLGDFQPEGGLHRFDASSSEKIIPDLTIPNTPGFTADGKTLYLTHSNARQIFKFDFEGRDGTLSNKTLFYEHKGTGEPDGFRFDVEGNLWTAVFGEGKVLKIDGSGRVVGEVSVPTPNTTCVQFVGTELVITTADDESEGGNGYGGHVFKIDVGVEGLELNDVKL